MQNKIVFNIPRYSNDNSTATVLQKVGYGFWRPLLDYFLAKSDTIEIHCWDEEVDTIQEIKTLFIEKIEISKRGNLPFLKQVIPLPFQSIYWKII